MLPNIHILGIQGSGKGTQSALLVERYGLSYISSGNLFRERSQADDALATQLAEELKKGRLLPDRYLFDTVQDYLQHTTIAVGLLGDGVIRTINQYHGLDPVWSRYNLEEPLLINLVLDEVTALERIQQRQREQEDPSKQEYHRIYSGKLIHRTDDNPTAIEERFAEFYRMTEPVVALFESKGRCLHFSAKADIQTVHHQIYTALEQHYSFHGIN